MKITIADTGDVLKDGERIGSYDRESNILLAERDIAPPEKRAITQALGHKPKYDIAPENEPSHETSEPKPFDIRKQYPDAPPLDPHFGDKTPAFALYLRDNHPEEFERRYAHRKIDLKA